MERDIAIRVYNTNFRFVGSVDEWISLIWKSVFNGDVGGFDLELPATKQNIEIFKQDYYVCRSDKESWAVTAKDQGGLSMTHFNDIMIVESVEISMDDEGRMRLTVGGSHITTILKRRVNLTKFNINNNEFLGFWEKLSRELIYDDVSQSSPTDHRRGLPINMLRSFENSNNGDIPLCWSLGFLTKFVSGAPVTTVNPRNISGYPLTSATSAVIAPNKSLIVYAVPSYGYPLYTIIKTTDDAYWIAVNKRVNTGGSSYTDFTFLPLSSPPPRPYRGVVSAPFASSDMQQYTIHYESMSEGPIVLLGRTTSGDVISETSQNQAFAAYMVYLYGVGVSYEVGLVVSVNGPEVLVARIATVDRSDQYQAQLSVSNESFFDILAPLATTNDVGLALYYTKPLNTQPPTLNRPFRFAIYDGEERDVVFSLDNENLLSYTQSLDTQSYSNVAYISAKYPANPTDTDNIRETDLVTFTPSDISEDILRREIFINSDASYKDDISGAIIQIDAFRNSLVAEGNSELQSESHSIKHDFDCEILAESSLYELYRDYFVGDKVWVYLPTGEKYQARIQEVTESWNDEGYKVQLKLKYIYEEDATQLLLTESEDILTTEGGDNLLVEEGV